jgi:hypothetical protein
MPAERRLNGESKAPGEVGFAVEEPT